MGMPWKLRFARIKYRVAHYLFNELEDMRDRWNKRLDKPSRRLENWLGAMENLYGNALDDIAYSRWPIAVARESEDA